MGVFGWVLSAVGYLGLDAVLGMLRDSFSDSPEERTTKQQVNLMREARMLEDYRSKAAGSEILRQESDAKYFQELQARVQGGLMRGAAQAVGANPSAPGPEGQVDVSDVSPRTGFRPGDTMRNTMNPVAASRGIRSNLLELLGPTFEEAQANKLAATLLQEDQVV